MSPLPRHHFFAPLRTFVPLFGLLAAACLGREEPKLNLRLSSHARGNEAITALGPDLPEVARYHGLETQKLVTLLRTQPSLEVERNGALLFVCAGLPANAPKPAPSNAPLPNSSTVQIATGTAVDAFRLHSRPGANRVIFLDFDGHTTSGTSWNSVYTANAPIVSQPFDQDGNPATFSASERAVIESIWKRVAEDYAPFAVDVTTEDPGVEALRKANGGDSAFGIRVVISPTNWYNTGAGGTAYVGSFDWDTDTPCWVFTQQLANTEKYIAEAISHEVGHTMGLFHDGSATTEYYGGQGSWAPIMGVSYYKPVTQFSKGDYPGANNVQDDFTVMAGYAPLNADDYGNTLATATALSGPTVSVFGTIETSADVDVFKFTTTGSSIALAVDGLAPEPNLNIKAELLSSAGTVLQTSNPTGLSAAIAASLASGTYYIRISGSGDGDPQTTGYPAYGSVGNYRITGTLAQPAAAPSAVASANTTSGVVPLTVAFSSAGSNDSDGTIVSYLWNFGNGATSTAANPSYTYTTTGTFTVTLTVTDNSGLTGTAGVTIAVNAVPPAITAQPSSTEVLAGTVATLSAAASGAPTPTLQWRKNGTAISGATNATLALTVTAVDAGAYTLLATNAAGTAESNPATLTVDKVPQTVAFTPPAEVPFTTGTITLSASASSALPVTYAVQSGPASIAAGGLTVSGPGTVTIRAQQAGNDIYQSASADASIVIKPNFLYWQQIRFNAAELADPARSGAGAVYGADGLPNLVKYSLGLDPKVNATSGLPETAQVGSEWVYTYLRPASVTDIVYAVEISSDLTTWTTSGVIHEWVSTVGGVDTWRARYSISGTATLFFRLKVTQP